MLSFEPMSLEQIERYSEYYDRENAIGCESNMVSAYLWRNEYLVKFAELDGSLIKAYFRDESTVWSYCLPKGGNVKRAVERLALDAAERNGKLSFCYMTASERDELEQLFPGKFRFELTRGNMDYIYLSESLASLSGRKLHSKRNHITRFFREFPNSELVDINSNNACDALTVAEKWCAEHGLDADTDGELAVIKEALSLLQPLKMRGLLLYVNGEPAAMALGSEISKAAFDVNFEKALKSFDGAYSVINNAFAKRLTSYKYINREEDLGIEGLRKAKLSYRPEIIYERFDAYSYETNDSQSGEQR